jgi:hypothetical protein
LRDFHTNISFSWIYLKQIPSKSPVTSKLFTMFNVSTVLVIAPLTVTMYFMIRPFGAVVGVQEISSELSFGSVGHLTPVGGPGSV